jgi:hypothetical protein
VRRGARVKQSPRTGGGRGATAGGSQFELADTMGRTPGKAVRGGAHPSSGVEVVEKLQHDDVLQWGRSYGGHRRPWRAPAAWRRGRSIEKNGGSGRRSPMKEDDGTVGAKSGEGSGSPTSRGGQ